MSVAVAENRSLHTAVRAFQIIFAIVVIGTVGYAIHEYEGYSTWREMFQGEMAYLHHGVPNAWGFLLFCAAWTILVAIFQLFFGNTFADRGALFSYVRVGVEVVAVISWFAGWIAVAANIGTKACPDGYKSCAALTAATVFGAFEWLLFTITAFLVISPVLNSRRRPTTPKSRQTVQV